LPVEHDLREINVAFGIVLVGVVVWRVDAGAVKILVSLTRNTWTPFECGTAGFRIEPLAATCAVMWARCFLFQGTVFADDSVKGRTTLTSARSWRRQEAREHVAKTSGVQGEPFHFHIKFSCGTYNQSAQPSKPEQRICAEFEVVPACQSDWTDNCAFSLDSSNMTLAIY